MKRTTILRKRYIPSEVIDISGDEILYRDENLLVTRWKAIKPRADISGGISYAFLKDGIKISRFYDNSNKFLYWYCDIIDAEYDKEKDLYLLTDLLLDVKISPDGTARVLDADELAEALQKGMVTKEQAARSLKRLDSILSMVYQGIFPPDECGRYEY